MEQLQALVHQLAAPLTPDQAAFIQGKQQGEGGASGCPPCFGAGLKFRLETSLPGDAELAYLSQPVPPSRHAQLTFSLDAVRAAAAAAAGPTRRAEEIGVDWLDRLVISFYGDEKPLGRRRIWLLLFITGSGVSAFITSNMIPLIC